MTDARPPTAPVLCVVHDDASVREELVRDLRARFSAHYQIDAHADAAAALEALREHAGDGSAVAAVFRSWAT